MLKLWMNTGTYELTPMVVRGEMGCDLAESIDDYYYTFGYLPVTLYSPHEVEGEEMEEMIPVNGGEYYIKMISHFEEPSHEEAVAWALAFEIGEEVEDFQDEGGYLEVETTRGTYYILNDDQADEAIAEYVEETLWAFKPTFLSCATGLNEVVFKKLQELHEDANDAIKSLVKETCGMGDLVGEAIDWDGRGHFLNPYDGEEIELEVDGFYYFAYRQ